MFSAFSGYHEITVVIWTTDKKETKTCYINKHTTIQDIINSLELDKVCMAFLGGDRRYKKLDISL